MSSVYFSIWQWVIRTVDWTNIVIAIFTVVLAVVAILQAYFTRLSYKVYKLMSRPMVFARLWDRKEKLGIRVENAGNGVAWNGKVKVTALPSNRDVNYTFMRLYGRAVSENPTGDQPTISYNPEDKRLKISIDYEDEERGGEKYHWEEEFDLPREWLTTRE